MKNRLVVMVKAPRMGQVKTRLSRGIGASEALRFYRTATRDLLREVSGDPRWETWLAIAPDTESESPVWPLALRRMTQGHGGLGDRMQSVFNRFSAGPVVIIGSDIPGISRHHIASAFKKLGQAEVVFGPAEDGGYWLVGQRRMPRVWSLFEGVRWSTEFTLSDTLANVSASGLVRASVAMLDHLPDVDEASDYISWRRAEPGYHR